MQDASTFSLIEMSVWESIFSVESSYAMIDKAASFQMPRFFVLFFPLLTVSYRFAFTLYMRPLAATCGTLKKRLEFRFHRQLLEMAISLKFPRSENVGKLEQTIVIHFLPTLFWIPLIGKFGFDPEEVLVTSLLAF